MPESTTTSAPGWYPDPASDDQLRFWDGTRWTAEVRAAFVDPARPAADADAAGSAVDNIDTLDQLEPPDRQRNYATIVLGIVIAFFALAGFYEVIAGNSSGNSNPNRFAVPATTTTEAPAVSAATRTGDCNPTPPRADAPRTVRWLASKGIPASQVSASPSGAATTVTPTAPSLSPLSSARWLCSHVFFADARAATTNELWAYASGGAAARAAAAETSGSGVTFAFGYYVVRLGAGLEQYQPTYRAALKDLIATQVPKPSSPAAVPSTLPQPEPAAP